MENHSIAICDSIFDFKINSRKPYFRIRGVSLSSYEKNDFIHKCDILERTKEIEYTDGYKGVVNPEILLGHSPRLLLRENNLIGINTFFGYKYPDVVDITSNITDLIELFPYLEFICAITELNEIDRTDTRVLQYYNYEEESAYDGKWNDYVVLGIHVKDGHYKYLYNYDTMKLYHEYNSRYGLPDYSINLQEDPYEDV